MATATPQIAPEEESAMHRSNRITAMAAALLSASALLANLPAQAVEAEAGAQIVINAPAQRVWTLLTQIDRWPEWNKAVDVAQLKGAVATGSVFVWKSQGFTVTSTLQDVEPLRRLTWTGQAIGTHAYHEWNFEAIDGTVVVRTHETFDGWLPWLLKGAMQKKLDDTLPQWLATLKAAAERAE
jgi:uncharacterized protein YndB with AHSA1/START domain